MNTTSLDLKRLSAIALALLLGTLGGSLAHAIEMPLAWMIGSMLATTIAAMAGAPIAMARNLRMVMVVVLGVMLGSGFTPEILDTLRRWQFSLAAVGLYIITSTAIVSFYFRRVCGYDRTTAFFASPPGGLSEMILVGGEMGGDERRISLVHASRILLVVMTIPLAFRFLFQLDSGSSVQEIPTLFDIPRIDLFFLVASGIGGWLGARALRIPAAAIIGPMVTSAALHLAGITDARPPASIVAMAQIAVGAAIGARFAGTPFSLVKSTLIHALGATIILILITLITAELLDLIPGLDFAGVVLAFAPSGLAEMSLIAIALNIDAAFVATHHIVRILLIVVAVPGFYRWMEKCRR